MGATAGIHTQSTVQKERFAFKLVTNEYERLKTESFVREAREDVPSSNINFSDDSILLERLLGIYRSALQEYGLLLAECRNPFVIASKYAELSEEEVEEYTRLIVSAALSRDKKIDREKNKNAASTDYSRSFGGTVEDSQNEKEAAEILRNDFNGAAAEDDSDDQILRRPSITNPYDQFHLRKLGRWEKFLSQNCFMYVHNLTKDIVSVRPEDYVEKDEGKDIGSGTQLQRNPYNGLRCVDINDILEVIDEIIRAKKTPLLIDKSTDHNLLTFFSYKGMLEDISGMTIPFGVSGIKREEFTERCRKKLVGALKSGGTFVLNLGNVHSEHADFKTKLCKKDVFPKEVFIEGGRKLLQPDYDPKYKKIYREEDLESGQAIAREGFRVVIISTLDPYEFEALLEDCIPLGYLLPVYVNSPN